MKKEKSRSLRALDFANVFLADVRDGIGPYLAIFLMASYHWDAASIGIAMSAMGIATLIVQTPAGAFIDHTKYKRITMALSSLAIACSCVSMTIWVTLPAIVAAQVVCGIAAAFLAPGLAAVTLGLVGIKNLASRTGRNEGFNHFGNVMAAGFAGALGYYISREWIFYLVGAMALLSVVSVLLIEEKDIDHKAARGCEPKAEEQESSGGVWELLKDPRLLLFTVSMLLFHFANAAMLPLAGQLLSQGKSAGASVYMSACIIVAQLVMIPVALWAGKAAETIGRKPIFMIALIALPIRGVLYMLSHDPVYVVAVQILDGIGAGIFGVVSVLVIADLTRGSGRYNLASSAVATAVGIGAALSNGVAGYVVFKLGYNAGFMFLAGIAAVAAFLFFFFVPETRSNPERGSAAAGLAGVRV